MHKLLCNKIIQFSILEWWWEYWSRKHFLKHFDRKDMQGKWFLHTSVPYCNSPHTFVVGWVDPGIPLTPDQSRVSSKIPTTCKHWSRAGGMHAESTFRNTGLKLNSIAYVQKSKHHNAFIFLKKMILQATL